MVRALGILCAAGWLVVALVAGIRMQPEPEWSGYVVAVYSDGSREVVTSPPVDVDSVLDRESGAPVELRTWGNVMAYDDLLNVAADMGVRIHRLDSPEPDGWVSREPD